MNISNLEPGMSIIVDGCKAKIIRLYPPFNAMVQNLDYPKGSWNKKLIVVSDIAILLEDDTK